MAQSKSVIYHTAPRGRCFFIRSELSGHVVTVKRKNTPGAPLILWPNKSHTNPAQLFYEDPEHGTIRSLINDWCIESKGSELTVSPFGQDVSGQKWRIEGPLIQSRGGGGPAAGAGKGVVGRGRVVEVLDESRTLGGKVGCGPHTGEKHQHWVIIPAPPQCFTLHQAQVGQRLRLGERQEAEDRNGVEDRGGDGEWHALEFCPLYEPLTRQDLWYLDRFGVLRSAEGGLALDGSGGAGRPMVASPYSPANYKQQWVYRDRLLVNRHVERLVVTAQPLPTGDVAGLFPRENRGEKVQLWDIEYKLPMGESGDAVNGNR